jgi:hypothetical protein
MFLQLVYMEHRMFELKARFVPVHHILIYQEVRLTSSSYTTEYGGVDSRPKSLSR